jgi:ABC-type branched-subunit amino acid transport system substrate-binding protein/ABC-type amino acid transport substrate-binding protein
VNATFAIPVIHILRGLALAFLLATGPLLGHRVLAQGEWELPTCIDPSAFPYSSQTTPGIDNRVAEIIAEELGAQLVPVWTPANPDSVRRLQSGECDLIMGVAEGAAGLTNTVPYYRAPFVFVHRSDASFEIESIQDETLEGLRIAVASNGLAQYALSELGLGANALPLSPNRAVRGAERAAPLVDAVLTGSADIAIVYGPDAAPFVQRNAEALTMFPVTPEIVPPLIQMFRIVTMGVRQGDVALRDRMNVAIAARWDEIQGVFEELGLPLLTSAQPFASELAPPEVLRIGAVLPVATGRPALTDAMGNAAWTGALLAEDLLAGGDSGVTPKVLVASSPTAEAAARAARRLVATESVTMIVGGVGDGQAAALQGVAEELETVLFVNIGEPDEALRTEACGGHTFHVAASTSMYVAALAHWFELTDRRNWFLVHEDSEWGAATANLVGELLERLSGGTSLVASAAVPAGPSTFRDALGAIAEAQPDLVVALLPPQGQEIFLTQYGLSDNEAPITGLPWPVMQTREFLARLLQVTPPNGTIRAALWETGLSANGADELNQRFISRSGQPMDPSGWAAYAAVKILTDAVGAAGTSAAAAITAFLESPEAVFDVAKGPGVAFTPANHQLRQPLYMIELNRDAPWGLQVTRQIALADLAGQVPEDEDGSDYLERLARLGGVLLDDQICGGG